MGTLDINAWNCSLTCCVFHINSGEWVAEAFHGQQQDGLNSGIFCNCWPRGRVLCSFGRPSLFPLALLNPECQEGLKEWMKFSITSSLRASFLICKMSVVKSVFSAVRTKFMILIAHSNILLCLFIYIPSSTYTCIIYLSSACLLYIYPLPSYHLPIVYHPPMSHPCISVCSYYFSPFLSV